MLCYILLIFHIQLSQLVGIGGQSRSECSLLNREAAIDTLRKITHSRLLNRREVDKELHPHVICMSAPGAGKSRLADYGLEALKLIDAKDYSKLTTLANNGAALAIHVSYNNATPFIPMDRKLGASASLACRLLSSYFRTTSDAKLLMYLYGEDNIQSLTVETSLEVILSDHRRRLALPVDQDILLYIAVDDVSSIISSTDNGWTAADGKGFLKSIFDTLSMIYADRQCFVTAMVTGTVLGHTSEILINTNRKYINLAVPILSLDQSVQLAKDAFSRNSIDKSVLENFNWLEFKLLLSDIGGVPRYVWNAINDVLETRLAKVDFRTIRTSIHNEMSQRYGISASALFHPAIVFAALSRQPVQPNEKVLLDSSDSTTWIDLENRGLLFFSPSSSFMSTIVLPYIHLQSMKVGTTLTSDLFHSLCGGDWSSWEKFVASHDALLLTLYGQQRRKYISVAEYYRGAKVGESVKDILLTLPPAADLKHSVSVESASKRFPETQGSSLGPAMDSSVVYLNAKGAKLDIVVPHKVHNSTYQNAILYRSIHCKHTTSRTPLDPRIHVDVKKYTSENLAHMVSSSSKFLHVYISNRKLVDYPVDSNGAEQACGSNLLSDAIFVSRDELEGFFTRTFSDRILLMLESKASAVSTNEPNSIDSQFKAC